MPDNDKVLVSFWGTRGSIPTPGVLTQKYGGNTSCVSVRYKNDTLILDAGTGIRNLGLELAKEISGSVRNIHLLLSHTHWDHIQGLPFFTPAYLPNTRLMIYGSPRKSAFLGSILDRQMDVNYFPVQMNDLAAKIFIKEFDAPEFKIGDMTIEWQEQSLHPGGSVRYKIRAGRSVIIYATDVELDKIFPAERTGKESDDAESYRNFIKDADLLIGDGQYTESQYPSKAGYGHSSIPVLLKIAHEQNVKQTAVFHHEPQNSDMILDEQFEKYASIYNSKKQPMSVFWAREGLTMVALPG